MPEAIGNAKHCKPRPDFPLFPHATGRWAKKVRGKLAHFGPWDDPEGALARCLDRKDDSQAGRIPRIKNGEPTVRVLLNRFLTVKQGQRDHGELAHRSFHDDFRTCALIRGEFGLTRAVSDPASEDFEAFRRSIAKTRGHVALGNETDRVRVAFKYGFDAGLLAASVRFGPGFKRRSRKTLRQARQDKERRPFEIA